MIAGLDDDHGKRHETSRGIMPSVSLRSHAQHRHDQQHFIFAQFFLYPLTHYIRPRLSFSPSLFIRCFSKTLSSPSSWPYRGYCSAYWWLWTVCSVVVFLSCRRNEAHTQTIKKMINLLCLHVSHEKRIKSQQKKFHYIISFPAPLAHRSFVR